jgi:hemerythrin superfamily protein
MPSSAPKKSEKIRRTPLNALELIKNDHDSVRALFSQYDKALPGSPERETLIQRISRELAVHTAIEEELFYPALRDTDSASSMGIGDRASGSDHSLMQDEEDMALTGDPIRPNGLDYDEEEEAFNDDESDEEDVLVRAYEDHGIVKTLIEDLRHIPANSQERHNILLVLREAVINHMEEEEDQLFPMARINADLQQLGADMRAKQDHLRGRKAA